MSHQAHGPFMKRGWKLRAYRYVLFDLPEDFFYFKSKIVVNSYRLLPASFEKPECLAALGLHSCTATISWHGVATLPSEKGESTPAFHSSHWAHFN